MYYILEHDILPNGSVNVSEVGRSSFALALSYYYDRMSKMVVNEQFKSVHLMLLEENLRIRKQDDVETQWVEPVETEAEAPAEE